MNIPSLPVDSLYKFAALVGTLIALTSTYLPMHMIDGLNARIGHERIEVAKLEAEARFLAIQSTRIKEILDLTKQGRSLDEVLKQGKFAVPQTADEFKKSLAGAEDLERALLIKQAEVKAYLENTSVIFALKKTWMVMFTIGLLSGSMLAAWGFRRWYTRTQVLQDEILKRQLQGQK